MAQPTTVHLDSQTVTRLEYLRRVKNQQIGLDPADETFFSVAAMTRFCVQLAWDMQTQAVRDSVNSEPEAADE